MKKAVAFTICAKNYLAQALTLRASFLRNNPDIDFYLFLSDSPPDEELHAVIPVDDSIVPNCKSLAFKYNVIEFSTCVKPFCIDCLFNRGYDIVMYIDPDVYVYDRLDSLIDALASYSIVLTPHRIAMLAHEEGLVSNVQIAQNGVYNLGFAALKNDGVGRKIVDWWKERLIQACYLEFSEGLATDQKWMDCIPGYFPRETLISHDAGLNVAIWNLVEREIVLKDGRPYVKNKETNEEFVLKFFHFSGCSPHKIERLLAIIREKDKSNRGPFAILASEYLKQVSANGYSRYSKMTYAYDAFEDGTLILPINRRLYRVNEAEWAKDPDPFLCSGSVYSIFKKSGLLSKKRIAATRDANVSPGFPGETKSRWFLRIYRIMRVVNFFLGIDRYQKVVRGICGHLAHFENQQFLIRKH